MSLLAGIDAPFDTALFSGSTVGANDVPGRLECSINGHAYRIDRAFGRDPHTRKSVPVLRAQADTGAVPSEQSINRESLWRRSQETWHHGAGQTYFDRDDSDSARFTSSKGVNVWTKWGLSLLADTVLARSSASTNLRLTAAGSFTYLADGNSLLYTSDLTPTTPTFTAVTGTPASACNWITSDGYTIYAAYGTAIYTTTRGAATATSFSTGFGANVSVLGYVKGRLMAAAANSLYNITAGGAVGAALLTHSNSDFTWVGFAEGPGYIYAAGYSGTRSLIYKVGLTADGTALSAPIVAGELPTGETVRTVKGYLGFLLVGTDTGVRVGSIDGGGNLTFGSLIPTPGAVLNFEPQDRFVWFGYSNYDTVSTGLGRLDLSVFNDPLTPAYASDLMATGQGAVLSISTFGTRRVFTVSGLGVYTERTSLVNSGSLTAGRFAFGVGDDKVAMFVDLKHQPLNGSVNVALSANGSATSSLGDSSTAGSIAPTYPISAGQVRAEYFQLTTTLTSDSGTPTLGPVVTRLTLRAYPAPTRTFSMTVPLILHEQQVDLNGAEFTMDTLSERSFLEGLCKTQQLVTYQEAGSTYQVLIDDFSWVPMKLAGEEVGFSSHDGTFVLSLKEVSS